MDREELSYHPIGYIKSPYKQKFAIPRQPNLVPQAIGELELNKEFADPNTLREIESFSHLWLLFHFSETAQQGWNATVQPPRLGGKEKVGVFASRSPFRPNPIGLSVVENLGVELSAGRSVIKVGGIDVLDGTPVLDIKPYLPYADSLPDATAGFAAQRPGRSISVKYSDAALESLAALKARYPDLEAFIRSVLQQDPRPAWRVREDDEKQYGMSLYDLNIKWRQSEESISVLSIERLAEEN